MSLQVWLPLNGNTNNQGLQGDLIVNTTPAYVNGLFGQAMSTGKLTIPATMSQQIFSSSSVSFCFWIKPTGTTGSQCIFGTEPMSAGNNRMYSIFLYPSANDLHLSWQSETSSSAFVATVCSGVFPSNKWTHCAITYDSSIITVYINGVVQNTWTASNPRTNFAYDYPINSSTLRYLNDVRIYDHCLSAKEVKEISKGLVLHYKLDDPYIESTTNLFTSINTSLSNASVGTTTLWTNQANGTQEVVEFDGKKCFKFTYNGSSNRFYVTTPNPTVKATYSCKMYCASSANVSLHIERYPNYSWGGGTTSYTTPGKWQTVSLTLDNSYAGETCYFFIQGGSTAPVYVYDIQVEMKDHATPYTASSRSENIVYDSSGYGHNGTIIGSLATASNTARYLASTLITDGRSNYIKCSNFSTPTDTVTMSCWIKGNETGYSDYHIPFATDGAFEISIDSAGHLRNGFYINGSRQVITTNSKNVLDNNWHLLTATYDGATIRRYVDGAEVSGSSTAVVGTLTYKTSIFVGNYNGNQYGNNNLYMSDVRFYATALSAADIKELYETSASIDKNGNLYAREIKEV